MSERKDDKEKLKETPVKSKQSDETVNCAICSIIYAKKDVGKHKLWCSSNGEGDKVFPPASPIPEKAAHGFIYGKRHLFGPIFNDISIPKELQSSISPRLRERLIFLNPKSMRDCGLKIGDHVVATRSEIDGFSTIMASVVWPSSKVPLFSIGIPKAITRRGLSTLGKGYCGVSKISNIRRAIQITLIPDPDAARTAQHHEEFARVCRSYLNGTCLKDPEDVVQIPYFAQLCVMRTVSTTGDFLENSLLENSNSLPEKFSAGTG